METMYHDHHRPGMLAGAPRLPVHRASGGDFPASLFMDGDQDLLHLPPCRARGGPKHPLDIPMRHRYRPLHILDDRQQ